MNLDKNELISVIVPVYNVEKYLDKCIESIVKQTYENFELLLIDDGSTDKSSELCDLWATRDSRIKVFHKPNGGLSDARNYGLARMKGEYVTFIDSDDYVAQGYIETLFRLIRFEDVDVSMVHLKYVVDDDEPVEGHSDHACEIISNIDAMRRMFLGEQQHCGPAKLYRKNTWEHISYPVGRLYEDYLTTYRLIFRANKVAVLDEQLYYYRQRTGSIMRIDVSERKLSLLDASDEVTGFIEKNCPEILVEAKSLQITFYLKCLQQILNSDKKAFLNYQERIVKKVKKETLPLLISKNVPKKVKVKILLFCMGKKIFRTIYNLFDGVVKV